VYYLRNGSKLFLQGVPTMVYTLEEVAEILKVSVATVRKLVDTKELKAFKVRGQWRVRKEDLDDYIARQFR
jgi:excisionase family DNA binding protein